MRVGIVGLLQEANTFLPNLTTVEHFRQDTLLTGETIYDRFAAAHHEVGGFFEGLAPANIAAAPIFLARALPFGAIAGEAHRRLLNIMLAELEEQPPLDGILAACHGANVAEDVADVDGHWLGELRRRLGPGAPLIATIDPHANLSRQMVECTDAIIAYRTNPHTDQRACGRKAAELMTETLAGAVRPTQAACFPPMAINIERQLTSSPPCLPHYRAADVMLAEEGVLSNSLVLGFPYADVPEMGASVVVVTDGRPRKARESACKMAQALWNDRKLFMGELIDAATAIDRASRSVGPVCLLDMGDNVGGGAPGDGAVLLHHLHAARLGPAVVCICDPQAVEHAAEAGVGAQVELQIGGKSGVEQGAPLEEQCTVVNLCDGRFEEPEPRHGGFATFDQGPTAVVVVGDHLTVVLTSRRMAPFSLGQLTCCGVDPAKYRILVAKGVHAPVAAYQGICRRFIRVNTPGVTTADLTRLHYARRRRPLFPFEQDFHWSAL